MTAAFTEESLLPPPDSPHPASVLRYNARHSALLVTADAEALRVECRGAPASPVESEQTIEAYTLGNAAAASDFEDEYSFFAEAGESITLSTDTPGAGNLLDPVLKLLRPDGQVVLTAGNGMPDGKNVKVDFTIPATGPWRVQVRPETARAGAYTLQLSTLSPQPDFSRWVQQLPPGKRGPMDDPDEDGLPNLTEFASGNEAILKLDSGVLRAEVDWDEMVVTFKLPSPLPRGVSAMLEEAPNPAGPWEPSAWRTPLNDWTARPGARLYVRNTADGLARIVEVRFVSTQGPRRFVRLRFSLNR